GAGKLHQRLVVKHLAGIARVRPKELDGYGPLPARGTPGIAEVFADFTDESGKSASETGPGRIIDHLSTPPSIAASASGRDQRPERLRNDRQARRLLRRSQALFALN